MKKLTRVLVVFLLVLFAGAELGFVGWLLVPFGPGRDARAALVSDPIVSVAQGADWVTFIPAGRPPTTGLILYPGAHVDYRSYAPVAREIARRGYQVTVVKMPANLAIFGASRADRVIAAYPGIRRWAIGGHSLGGMMAAWYASRHPEKVRGVVFWAAFPVVDLSRTDLAGALSYGTQDSPLEVEAVRVALRLLPPGSSVQAIQGGGHTGFGDYTSQFAGAKPAISPEQQQAYAADLTVRLLHRIEGN